MTGTDYRRNTFLLIIIVTALKLFFASTIELNADEAYYWTYALKLQWSYFDHPPMVAALIRLSTFNLLFHHEVFVRLGAIMTSAAGTWLMFKAGSQLKDQRTGWFAALLYTTSIYCSITVGTDIMPDSPQMVFWLASIMMLIKIERSSGDIPKSTLWWCLFGLFAGLAIMSKIHGAFLWLGAVLYVLLSRRDWLRDKGIYLGLIITLIVISPMLIWNFRHHFITYHFHRSRMNLINSGIHPISFLKVILQQISINNPFNFFLIVASITALYKGRLTISRGEGLILLCCGLPLILVVLFLSLFSETFPHWSGPGYSSLLLLPAVSLASRPNSGLFPKSIRFAFIYLLFIALLQMLIINYCPGTLSTQKSGIKTGELDFTLDTYGWENLGKQFASLYKKDLVNKTMPRNAPIIVTNWFPAATIQYYVAYQTGQPVVGIGNIFDLHQYYWTYQDASPLKRGGSAYFIVPSDSFYYRTTNEVFRHFDQHTIESIISQYRSGVLCRYVTIYRLTGYTGK